MPDPNTREIEVVVQRIMLADGTLIQREEDNLALPDVAAIGEYLADVNLVREYKEKTIETAKYVPVKAGHYWRCTCGAINLEEEAVCHRCKASVLTLFKYLDKNALQSSIDEKKRLLREKEERERIAREKEEEQKRIEREKEEERRRERSRIEAAEAYAREEERRRKSKKRVRICAVIGSFAFAAYLVWSLIIPAIQYKKADELLSAGDRDAAYTTFMGITRYGDSYNRACAIRYEDARAAFTAGDYDKAYDLFTSISNFSDSATRAKDAVYQKAKVLMEAGEYTEAALLYESLSGYLDSKARGTECRNEQTFIDATAQFEMGHYKKAGELFESLKTYKDSSSLMMQSYYLYAKNLIESGELHSGYVILSTKVNQGDSSYEDSIELANAAEYQYAADCFAGGNYTAAVDAFTNLKDYKDSAARCLESKYQYGLSLIGEGKYDIAITVFQPISNYRDSAKQLNEAKYQKALLLMSQEEYKEAESIFEELGYYRDSANQLKECKYKQANKLFRSMEFTKAADLFKELGYYGDSIDMWKASMYAYVKLHLNNDDQTTYEYLTELRKYNYESSKSYYDDLYRWSANIVINTSEIDYTTKVSTVSANEIVYCHFTLKGGTPGETIAIKAIGYWSAWNDSSAVQWKNEKNWRDGSTGNASFSFVSNSGEVYKGNFTFKVFSGSTVIGEASVQVVSATAGNVDQIDPMNLSQFLGMNIDDVLDGLTEHEDYEKEDYLLDSGELRAYSYTTYTLNYYCNLFNIDQDMVFPQLYAKYYSQNVNMVGYDFYLDSRNPTENIKIVKRMDDYLLATIGKPVSRGLLVSNNSVIEPRNYSQMYSDIGSLKEGDYCVQWESSLYRVTLRYEVQPNNKYSYGSITIASMHT